MALDLYQANQRTLNSNVKFEKVEARNVELENIIYESLGVIREVRENGVIVDGECFFDVDEFD